MAQDRQPSLTERKQLKKARIVHRNMQKIRMQLYAEQSE